MSKEWVGSKKGEEEEAVSFSSRAASMLSQASNTLTLSGTDCHCCPNQALLINGEWELEGCAAPERSKLPW